LDGVDDLKYDDAVQKMVGSVTTWRQKQRNSVARDRNREEEAYWRFEYGSSSLFGI